MYTQISLLIRCLRPGMRATLCFVCVCRVMEEEEERRQQTAMKVRLKKEKSEEILKERENAVRKVLMPAYSQLLVK